MEAAPPRPEPAWREWLAALRNLRDNPLPTALGAIERRQWRRSRRAAAGRLILLAVLAAGILGWMAAGTRKSPLPAWTVPALLLLAGAAAARLMLPVTRGTLGLLAEGDSSRGSGPLQLDEALACSALSDADLVVGVLRRYWPRCLLAAALLALPVCAQQSRLAGRQLGLLRTAHYPHTLRPGPRETGLYLAQQAARPLRLSLLLVELATGGVDPAPRFRWGLPLTYAGVAFSGALAGVGWLALLIACGRGLKVAAAAPLAAVGGALAQAALLLSLAHEWEGQRLGTWSNPPPAADWLLTSLALAVVGALLALQLLPGSALWRGAMASGLPLLLCAALPWLLARLAEQSAAGSAPAIQQALASGASGLRLALSSAALANPLAAPVPLYGGLMPDGLFTPPLWQWLSWPLLTAVQVLLVGAQLGQARLAVRLARGAELL